jgi:hypothetical protein
LPWSNADWKWCGYWPSSQLVPWIRKGREGYEVIALIAEQHMNATALERAKAILGGSSLEKVASWADEYRHDHRQTAPWH